MLRLDLRKCVLDRCYAGGGKGGGGDVSTSQTVTGTVLPWAALQPHLKEMYGMVSRILGGTLPGGHGKYARLGGISPTEAAALERQMRQEGRTFTSTLPYDIGQNYSVLNTLQGVPPEYQKYFIDPNIRSWRDLIGPEVPMQKKRKGGKK